MTLATAAITLFFVMDSLGNIPIFISILNTVDEKRRTLVIIRESVIAFFILVIFLFLGEPMLNGLHITQPALGIAGGIVLFLISIRMIFPPDHEVKRDNVVGEPFIVPMAIPLTAGPSAIAMVLLFASTEPERMLTWFMAVAIASVMTMCVLLSAPILKKIMGQRGLIAMERLMGMILIALAVQMFLNGVEEYFMVAKSSASLVIPH